MYKETTQNKRLQVKKCSCFYPINSKGRARIKKHNLFGITYVLF